MTSFEETVQSLQPLIKHRTARLVARTFHGPEHANSEYVARHHPLVALQAIALGHAPHLRIRIQQLECYEPQWTTGT